MDNQLKCPNCKSTDIEDLKKGALYLAMGSLVVAVILYFVFPYIKIVAACAIFGVLCLIMALRPGGNYLCKTCKHKFKEAN
jgi:hypothetical protein